MPICGSGPDGLAVPTDPRTPLPRLASLLAWARTRGSSQWRRLVSFRCLCPFREDTRLSAGASPGRVGVKSGSGYWPARWEGAAQPIRDCTSAPSRSLPDSAGLNCTGQAFIFVTPGFALRSAGVLIKFIFCGSRDTRHQRHDDRQTDRHKEPQNWVLNGFRLVS